MAVAELAHPEDVQLPKRMHKKLCGNKVHHYIAVIILQIKNNVPLVPDFNIVTSSD